MGTLKYCRINNISSCHYCGRKFRFRKNYLFSDCDIDTKFKEKYGRHSLMPSYDHSIPITRGGLESERVICCRQCNAFKNQMTLEEFLYFFENEKHHPDFIEYKKNKGQIIDENCSRIKIRKYKETLKRQKNKNKYEFDDSAILWKYIK